jgi:hypothetical protein
MAAANTVGNALGNSLANAALSQSSQDLRFAAMDRKVDEVMGDIMRNANLEADVSGLPGLIADWTANGRRAMQFTGLESGAIDGALVGGYDLSDRANHAPYLKAVNYRRANGLPLDSQDILTSKAILFHYQGYPMGESDASSRSSVSIADQLAGALDDAHSPALDRALVAFSKSSAGEQSERFEFYSGISQVGTGRGREVNLSRDGRTVKIGWSPTFSDYANDVHVGADEALRKTDFAVYKKVVDAAFATENIQGVTIEGTWRPSADGYKEVTGRVAPYSKTSLHISSRALDISMIEYADGQRTKLFRVNNGGYDLNAKIMEYSPKNDAIELFNSFRTNLGSGWREIYDPWKMQKGTNTWGNSPAKLNLKDLDYLHMNHLHISLNR